MDRKYHYGEIVKLLKSRNSGYIRDLKGGFYFFNAESAKVLDREVRLRVGVFVVFKIVELFDDVSKRTIAYATDLEYYGAFNGQA